MFKKLLTSVLIVLLTTPSFGATYFISTSGNDSNSGTILSPWASVAHGIGVATAGDFLMIRGGTYNDTMREQAVTFHSGTSGNPITIGAYNGESVIENVNFDNVIEIETAQYLIFQDMTLNATTGRTWSSAANCTNAITNNGDNNIFRRMTIIGPNVSTIRGQGILTGENADNNTYEDLEIYNFSEHGFYEDGHNNEHNRLTLHDNGFNGSCNGSAGPGSGIQINCSGCDPTGNVIHNSLSYHNGEAGFIINGSDALLYNNIAYLNTSYGIQSGVTGSCCRTNARVYNNTTSDNFGGINDTNGMSGGIYTNNIAYGNSVAQFARSGVDTPSYVTNVCTSGCEINGNPQFINSGSHDYRLNTGSAATGVGTSLSGTFTNDYLNTTRTLPWDVGAYKYTGGGTTRTIQSNFITSRTVSGDQVVGRQITGDIAN